MKKLIMQELQDFVNGFGFGISKEELIKKIYRQFHGQFEADGHDFYILNDKYFGVDDKQYQLKKSHKFNMWLVEKF